MQGEDGQVVLLGEGSIASADRRISSMPGRKTRTSPASSLVLLEQPARTRLAMCGEGLLACCTARQGGEAGLDLGSTRPGMFMTGTITEEAGDGFRV